MNEVPNLLSPAEIERYARHIVLREVGGAGQQRLKTARVMVVGAGGIGAPVLLYLAAAGIGHITIIDDDRVSLSNLQRQIIHATPDVGRLKIDSAREAVAKINPHVAVLAKPVRLHPANALSLVEGHDVVVDGSDNFATRYALADVCATAKAVLVSAAVGRFEGSLTTLKPFAKRQDGRFYPGYRDIFPAPPPDGTLPACAEAGLLGALTGVVGTMAAMEVLKEILQIGDSLAGRLLLIDLLGVRVEDIAYG